MSADRNVTATFNIVDRVQLTSGAPLNHPGIESAYAAAAAGAEIKAQTFLFPENLLFNEDKQVTLSGGWDGDYSTNSDSYTTIQGKLVIRSGSVRLRKITIR